MPLVPTGEIVAAASADRVGAGAFNVIQLEHAQAIVAGAEAAELPVILQISENTGRYHGAMEPLCTAMLAVARAASVPVAVHADHLTSEDLVREVVALGVGSVMFDASAHDHDTNVAETAAVTAWCHERDVWVEAELGEIGGKDGAHAPGVRTDPYEAADYVASTGVDALAVAVGSSHAMSTRDAMLDFDLVAAIHAEVGVPLVLHGSSGVPDADLTRAVAAGMTKINIATRLNAVFTATVRECLSADEQMTDPRRYLGPARHSVSAEVAHILPRLTS